ncbi:MAG TPA: hypothetical protein DCL21_01600 [Alphaproteobacteria bacterium]|nr:hypothetical protein [Alphaproteobacteria bacterium]
MTVYTESMRIYHIGDKCSWGGYRDQHQCLIPWNKQPAQVVNSIISDWDRKTPIIIFVAAYLSAENVHSLVKNALDEKGFQSKVPALDSDTIIVENNN